MFIIIGLLSVACSKDNSDPENDIPSDSGSVLTIDKISERWIVTGESQNSFKIFKFNNDSTFTIIDANNNSINESYTIDNKLINLNNYGTISDISLTDSDFNFTLTTHTKNTSGGFTIKTSKGDPSARVFQLIFNGEVINDFELYTFFGQYEGSEPLSALYFVDGNSEKIEIRILKKAIVPVENLYGEYVISKHQTFEIAMIGFEYVLQEGIPLPKYYSNSGKASINKVGDIWEIEFKNIIHELYNDQTQLGTAYLYFKGQVNEYEGKYINKLP